jgi:hypothetical protein
MAPGDWRFSFRKDAKMSDLDLELYQKKLLEIREKFSEKLSFMSNCRFFEGNTFPPSDNIFGQFLCDCKRHTPKCQGWYLLWNPNLPATVDKSHSSLHNHCSTWQFKSVSKMIQNELEKGFSKYFEMYDDDDTHPYCLDSFYNLKYGFKCEDEEFPDFVSTSMGIEEAHFEVER